MYEYKLIALAAIGIPSLIAALWHGGIWEEHNPDKLGFKWGFFVSYSSLINNVLFFGFITLVGFDKREPSLLFFGLATLLASVAIAYFSILRMRWALVVSTIMSLNPLWMIINIFYLKNRWPEFCAESSTQRVMPAAERLKLLPRDIRAAFFVAIAWIVCVLSFVFLLNPYGRYMRGDDMVHMFGVTFLPILIGFGLFFLYRKFVK